MKKKNDSKSKSTFIKGKRKKNLLSCLKDNSISSTGKFVIEFEKKLAKYLNRKYAIAVKRHSSFAISRRVIKFKKRR